ncbi:MAG: hypothetical protein KBT69_01500, partial [Oceanihabitans sp.]|nr:hypothetical protein [Oceanihabitans sp.]
KMKSILKTNIKIIVLFFALTLVNCEKEDVEQTNSFTELGFTVKEYSFKTANKKLKFKEAYSKVINGNTHPENQNSKERSTSEFSIDSTTIREIEINGLTSYTMLVTNALEKDVFKNMVIQIDSSQIISAFLITYYSESLEYLDIHDSFVFQGVKAVERIDYDSSLITSFVLNDECSVVLSCGWGDFVHPAGANCTPAYIFETVECLSGGGGSTSNGGGPITSGSNTNTPVTSPVPNPKPKPFEEILECIPSLLDVSGAVNWLQENKYEAAKIKDFLQDEDGNCMLENYDFALEAIEAMSNNSDLDFDDIEELINGMDKDCQALAVFRSIYKINSTFTNTISDYFLRTNEHNLNLQDWATGQISDEVLVPMPANVGARVLYRPSADGTLILQFNNTHLDTATTLGFINTFYHELVHAYILRLYYTGELLNEYPAYTDLKTAMDNFFNDDTNDTLFNIYDKEMHDIYVDFIDQLAESIVAYCDYNNINGVDLEYAEKLVWGGLNGYDVFFDNLTTPQEIEAQTLLAYENSNITANAKGTKTCD